MFEASLKTKLMSIFDLPKASYSMPGESQEQDCIFIDVQKSTASIKDGEAFYKVTGKCLVTAPHESIPFGFFLKKIKLADIDDTKDLFFYDIEESVKLYANIVTRSFSFVYFYSVELDPDNGSITSVTFDS